MKGFFEEFRTFAVKGNVVDMAIGIVVGSAFTAIVSSMVKDLFSPLIGLITGGMNFSNLFVVLKPGATPAPYLTLEQAQQAGAVTLNYGNFINSTISFAIIAFAAFIIVRAVNRLRTLHDTPAPVAEKVPDTKSCPFCLTQLPLAASRCPACTSHLDNVAS